MIIHITPGLHLSVSGFTLSLQVVAVFFQCTPLYSSTNAPVLKLSMWLSSQGTPEYVQFVKFYHKYIDVVTEVIFAL